MTTDVYPRDNCIAPDMCCIVYEPGSPRTQEVEGWGSDAPCWTNKRGATCGAGAACCCPVELTLCRGFFPPPRLSESDAPCWRSIRGVSQTCYWWVGPDKAWDGVVARPGKDPARLVLLLGGAEAQPRPYDGTLPDRHPDCLR